MSTFLLLGVLLCSPLISLANAAQSIEHDDYMPLYENGLMDEFDWTLLKAVVKENRGNIIISPISLKIVLALVYEAAAGTTETELREVLKFHQNKTFVRQEYSNIIDSLQNYKKYGCDDSQPIDSNELYTLKLGTRVFLDEKIQPQQLFQAKACEKYRTKIEPTNFADAQRASNTINAWVDKLTMGRINKLVTPDDVNNAVMFIANAIYFKGFWYHQFPKNETKTGGFYLTPKNTIQVEYMANTDVYFFTHSKELDAKLIRIPYKGLKFSMIIMLPNAKAGLEDLIKQLTITKLKNHIGLMDKTKVDLILPKFKFDFQTSMTDVLKSLGLVSLFQNTASLPGILRSGGAQLQVSNIMQKSGIEVNEEGSVAYASTTIQIANKFGDAQIDFNATHPFLFFIEDQTTHTILFVGKVENPLDSNPIPTPSRFGDNSLDQTNLNAPASGANNYPNLSPNLTPLNEPEQAISKRFNYFDLELLREVASDENVFISPASIKATLGMVLEGAKGNCAEEIVKTLRLPLNQNDVRKQLEPLLYDLSDRGAHSLLESVNGIFASNKLTVSDSYRKTIEKYYRGFVKTLDFTNSEAAAHLINSLVSNITRGSINEIVNSDYVRPDAGMVVMNALYFKGLWKKSFDHKQTVVKCFQMPNRQCVNAYMMQNTDNLNYKLIEDIDAHALEIPYSDDKYAMLILLPRVKNNIHALIKDLQHASFRNIVDKLEMAEVQFEIPRFEIEFSTELSRPLQTLGIRDIFGDKANLSGIVTNKPIFIDNIVHKTKITVDERGTIAAAATGAVVIPLMGASNPNVIADHPFAFFIYRRDNKNVLFEGIVNKPLEYNRGRSTNFYNPRGFTNQPISG
ncbi:PREDICTED: uncharacterized protein LOC108559574 [Nicrophorus vespilloides]|uniref:Uncharacterized protein LOC108559574 n=1 Tax=Nicrophorus vespilloides TaxID=110193 RepID=A0ABM1MCU1_NICVS|nr:PREDICTED: uncharacterized protein LOC108559574 [Nicrophorus vespilloides]